MDEFSGMKINIIGPFGDEINLNDFLNIQLVTIHTENAGKFTIANLMRLPSGLPSNPMEAITVINDVYAQYAALPEGSTSFGAKTIIKIYKFVAQRKLNFQGVDKIQIFNSTSAAVDKLIKDLRSVSRALKG